MTDKEKLDAMVKDLAADLRKPVTKIEASIATTQNHYGDYLDLLTGITKDVQARKVVALALVEAGANRRGVASALDLTT